MDGELSRMQAPPMDAQHGLEVCDRERHAIGPEEHPPDYHDRQQINMPQNTWSKLDEFTEPSPLQNEKQAVPCSPDYKCPTSPVPQSAHQGH